MADVAAHDAYDAPAVVANRDQRPLAVEIAEGAGQRVPVGEPCIDQFVGSEAPCPQRRDGTERVAGRVPDLGPAVLKLSSTWTSMPLFAR